jgi:hypothetical protein
MQPIRNLKILALTEGEKESPRFGLYTLLDGTPLSQSISILSS